jgi:hypothetical protein
MIAIAAPIALCFFIVVDYVRENKIWRLFVYTTKPLIASSGSSLRLMTTVNWWWHGRSVKTFTRLNWLLHENWRSETESNFQTRVGKHHISSIEFNLMTVDIRKNLIVWYIITIVIKVGNRGR